jgi:hypothetical protein
MFTYEDFKNVVRFEIVGNIQWPIRKITAHNDSNRPEDPKKGDVLVSLDGRLLAGVSDSEVWVDFNPHKNSGHLTVAASPVLTQFLYLWDPSLVSSQSGGRFWYGKSTVEKHRVGLQYYNTHPGCLTTHCFQREWRKVITAPPPMPPTTLTPHIIPPAPPNIDIVFKDIIEFLDKMDRSIAESVRAWLNEILLRYGTRSDFDKSASPRALQTAAKNSLKKYMTRKEAKSKYTYVWDNNANTIDIIEGDFFDAILSGKSSQRPTALLALETEVPQHFDAKRVVQLEEDSFVIDYGLETFNWVVAQSGAITSQHIDEATGVGMEHHQTLGAKLWMLWPFKPNKQHLEGYLLRPQGKILDGDITRAIRELEGLRIVVTVAGDSFILPAGEIHAVVTLEASSHFQCYIASPNAVKEMLYNLQFVVETFEKTLKSLDDSIYFKSEFALSPTIKQAMHCFSFLYLHRKQLFKGRALEHKETANRLVQRFNDVTISFGVDWAKHSERFLGKDSHDSFELQNFTKYIYSLKKVAK